MQALYREYREGKLLVNRKYQRKLVWSVDEKRQLIDSILRGYPIPLILLAERPDVHGPGKFEIIDGIQRFNAIFTFIENAFDYNGKFFDVAEFARAKQAAEDGVFRSVTDQPLLDRQECANLLDYHIAVTVYPTAEEGNITEVFGRINSAGRQLSYQEQRQAGVDTGFARLVRTYSHQKSGEMSQKMSSCSQKCRRLVWIRQKNLTVTAYKLSKRSGASKAFCQ